MGAQVFAAAASTGSGHMKLGWVVITWGLAAGLGCSSTPATDGHAGQSGGAGAGGSAGAGGGAAGTGGRAGAGGDRASPGVPFTGRRSYDVMGALAAIPGNTGAVSVASHRFTMVVDADASSAIVGDVGNGSVVGFTVTPTGALSFTGPVTFSSGAGSSGWSIRYTQMTVSFAGAGALSGTAEGMAYSYSADTDVGRTATVTAALTGVPDAIPPMLTVSRDGAEDDPFSSLTATASEPLPPDARPTLVAVGGATTPLALPTTADSRFVNVFYGPRTLLRYGQGYEVRVVGINDFANRPASGGAAFMTRAAPPLVAEDGFESTTGTMLGGAQVLTGAGTPTITGARSIYIAPINSGFVPVVRPRTTRLALRLAVTPGDTVLRFGYRMVNPSSFGGGLGFYIASEEGTVGGQTIRSGSTTTTTTATIPGQGDVSLAPIATAEIPLPADVGGEIVIAESLPALNGGLPAPPTPGIIIDDLRVE